MIGSSDTLGTILTTIFAFQQKMSTTFAPFFTFNLNLKAAIVSLQTMIMITKALNGTQMQAAKFAVDKATRDKIAAEVGSRMSSERLTALRAELAMLQGLEIQDNQRITNAKNYGRVSNEIQIRNNALFERERLARANNISLAKREFGAMNISKAKKKELSTALDDQMLSQIKLNQAIEAAILILKELIAAEEMIEIQKQENVTLNKREELSIKASTAAHAKKEAQLETEAIAYNALQLRTMKFGAAVMGADMAIMMFSKSIDKHLNLPLSAAQMSLGLTSISMIAMTVESFSSMKAMTQMGKAQLGQSQAARAGAAANNTWSRSVTIMGRTATVTAGTIARAFAVIAIVGLIAFQAAKHFNLFGMGADKAADDIDKLNKVLDQSVELTQDLNLVSALDMSGAEQMQNAIDEFAGSREEMFFGFKAGNVTGDLVKQVQVAGVENFVQNTEVIQTNNFNGMTTQEVAQEILDEIERGGKSRNIVFA